jgi:putative MATE family efflux protein
MALHKQSQITNEILQGNLIKLMFKLSTPCILGTLMYSLNSFLDALFAGQLIGKNALAGIILALPLTILVEGFALLVGVGSASVLSRAIGAGDIKTQSKIFFNLTVMAVVISFFITILGYSYCDKLIVFMGGTGEVASAGTEYFKVYILGSVFYILAIASSQLIKSEGKTKLDMIFASTFVIVNIVLNAIFVTIFHWGIHGIALATVIAMVVYSLVNLTYFISGTSSIPVNLKSKVLTIDLAVPILSVGISALLFPIMDLVQSFVILKSISYYGTNNDIAFYGATIKVSSFALIPISGFAQALQPIIGINYGAKNYDRLKKAYLTFAIIGSFLLILIWSPLQLSPKTFLSILLPDMSFTSNDELNFRILSILAPVWPLAILGNTLFQSIGKGQIVIGVILVRSLFLQIPIILILSKVLGIRGVYYGMVFADILFLLIVIILILIEFNNLNKLKVR